MKAFPAEAGPAACATERLYAALEDIESRINGLRTIVNATLDSSKYRGRETRDMVICLSRQRTEAAEQIKRLELRKEEILRQLLGLIRQQLSKCLGIVPPGSLFE